MTCVKSHRSFYRYLLTINYLPITPNLSPHSIIPAGKVCINFGMSKLIAILVTMKQRKRLIVRNVISHCYQRTTGGVVIFYNISDYLVFFTIFCTTARKYKVKILSLCLMADHIHICISEERKGELSAFVREYSKLFSRVHNRTCHTQGNLFESPFGSAPKFGDKIFLRQGLVPDIPQYPQSRYNFFPKRKILDIRATSVLVQKVEQGSKRAVDGLYHQHLQYY